MKKRTRMFLKISSAVIISITLVLGNAFFGNPISKFLANTGSKIYIKQKYNDLNLEIQKTFHSFKDGRYHIFVQSKDSVDTNFDIESNSFGIILRDTYSNINFNTWRRLDQETRERVSPIVRSNLDYDYDIENVRVGLLSDNMDEELTLDMKLDIYNPPQPYEVHIGIYTDDLTYEKIAEVGKNTYETMNKENLPMKSIGIVLIPPSDKVDEGEAISWQNSLTVFNIPIEILNSDNLPKAIEEYDKKQYEELEKEKKAEAVEDDGK